MALTDRPKPAPNEGGLAVLFSGLAGALLAVSLLKFGTPSVLEKQVSTPTNVYQIIFSQWPVVVGYVLLAGLALLAVIVTLTRKGGPTRASIPAWIFWLPLGWFVWQLVAALDTVSAELTRPTVFHFAATTLWFYVGALILGRIRQTGPFRLTLLVGFSCMLWSGVNQRFSGLEQMRDFFYSGHDVQLLSDDRATRGPMKNDARSDAVRVFVVRERC